MKLPLFIRRLRRRAYANKVRVSALCLAFAVLIGAGFYVADDPTALFHSSSDALAGGVLNAKSVALIGAGGYGPDDPVKRFNETRVGQVLYATTWSDNCRRVLFDNNTGGRVEAGEIFCGQTAHQVTDAESSNRLHSLRKSFQR